MPQDNLFNDSDDELFFAEDENLGNAARAPEKWRILIVDDEPDIHSVTKMVLEDYFFEGRSLDFISAYSGQESLKILRETSDIALVLLDVVMETNSAGLDVAVKIRNELDNKLIRIILRTGQPGAAPEHKVITELDINDYRQKTELTAQRLSTSVTTALRSYRDLRKIEENRISLARIAMSVAHQIRNRTMTISGFVGMAGRKLAEDSPVHEYLGTIAHESARLERIVSSVSDFASIEHFGLSEIDVKMVLTDQFKILADYAAEKNVKFYPELQAKDISIFCKPEYFNRLVNELCKNCIDFSSAGQVNLNVFVNSNDHNCYICFSDDGLGIDEKDLPFIYDPFFTTNPESVGMGLSIVSRIASEYNWEINVESKKGKGTKVFLAIPFEPVFTLQKNN